MSRLGWIFLVLAVVLLFAVTRVAVAQPAVQTNPGVDIAAKAFSPTPGTAAAAAAVFDARASAAIAYNACDRDSDYIDYRFELSEGYFKHQEEDLPGILIAKVIYLRTNTDPCHGTMVRFRPRDQNGLYSTKYADLQAFEDADKSVRASTLTSCAIESNERQAKIVDNNTNRGTSDLVGNNSREAILVDVTVSRDCMIRQVNEAILAMKKTTVLGSSGLPCAERGPRTLLSKVAGEFDVVDRDLVRLLYLGGPSGRNGGVLKPETIDYMYAALLATRRGPSSDSNSVYSDCAEPQGDELGSPEDTADRYAWYNKLSESLGDFFDWLFKAWLQSTAVAAVLGSGGFAEVPFLILNQPLAPVGDVRIPETENHRLMIETSRFLTNAAIIERLQVEGYDSDYVDDLREDQNAVREWLLHRLQDIASNDFREYNARPYTRYSLNAVLNLYDFAAFYGDATLRRAATIVLDLSEAKFAATSNRGRRTAPFRRLSVNDGYHPDHSDTANLYNIVSGGDHEVARAMILSGQTQLLDGGPSAEALGQMVLAASSRYQLPPPVLATAVERRMFSQTVKHAGVEKVFQSSAFTISAGGVPTDPTATTLGIGRDEDRGVAMPTVIMPTLAGWSIVDLFRFDGVGAQNARIANTCVAEGFACGVAPKIPDLYAPCKKVLLTSTDTVFVSSAVCFPGLGPHFYLAARLVDCSGIICPTGQQWGLMEIVEASPPPAIDGHPGQDPAFDHFQLDRIAALNRANVDVFGNGSYVTSAGHRIDFRISGGFDADRTGSYIRTVDDVQPQWTTAGDAIDADGTGRATLKGLGGSVTIDFSDWTNPKRTP